MARRTTIVSLIAGLAASAHAGPPLELVVSSADTIPGDPTPGVIWAQGSNGAFMGPSIDAAGNVAFRGRLAGGTVTTANDNGYWYGGPWNAGAGTMALQAREGSPCPGITPDATIASLTVNNVGMSPAGHMWMGIQLLTGTGGVTATNDRLILSGLTGALAPYVREGDPVPGLPDVVVQGAPDSTTQDKRVNTAGESVAMISLAGSGITIDNNAAIVAGAPGSLQLVLQRAAPHAAFPAGVVVNFFGNLFLNDGGDVLTGLEYLNGAAGVNANNDGVIATWIDGTLAVIAREGDPAAGLPAGVNYAPQSGLGASSPFQFGSQPWNNQNHAAFLSVLAGAVTTADDTALYAWTGGTPTLLHREGDPAPGLAGMTLGAFNQFSMRLNNQDQIVWTGTLVGGGVAAANDKVLYLTSLGGATTALYREGDPVPGLTGVNLGEPVNLGINGAGWIVFETTMTGSVTTSDDRALFVRDPAGEFTLLVREGDTHFGVLVSSWARNQDANGDGAASGFDDSGWLTLAVYSAGTTGVNSAVVRTLLDTPCYPDCNDDGSLTVADFGCFQTRFVAGDPYADCNADSVLTVADFGCFQTKFVAGCP